jgi:hypothetical protein
MTENDSFCETCGQRATSIIAEEGPPARLAFFCDEHVGAATVAPRAAVEDALQACTAASDSALAAAWQSVSDRYPDPVPLDAALRAKAGIPAGTSWDVLRRPPMSATNLGISARIQNPPYLPPR